MILKTGVAFFGLFASSAVKALETDVVANQKLHVLIFETESSADSPAFNFLNRASEIESVDAQVFGSGTEFEGYGHKYSAVYPLLRKLEPEALVVVSDGRDVLMNIPAHDSGVEAVRAFHDTFAELTAEQPNAVVVSAEAQCCVSALTHIAPGDLFSVDGTRKSYACASGSEDCLWNGDDMARPWEAYMKEIALTRTGSAEYDDVYLNAGLLAGKAGDLIAMIDNLQIQGSEDDQAVLTDYMFHNEDSIVLDYGQTIFGNNRGGVMGAEEDGCVFSLQDESVSEQLVHEKTGTSPLFVHSPGGFTKCHDALAAQLGQEAVTQTARRRLGNRKMECNYASCRRMT